MIEKIMILHELKLAGFNISKNLEKMYRNMGKKNFREQREIAATVLF